MCLFARLHKFYKLGDSLVARDDPSRNIYIYITRIPPPTLLYALILLYNNEESELTSDTNLGNRISGVSSVYHRYVSGTLHINKYLTVRLRSLSRLRRAFSLSLTATPCSLSLSRSTPRTYAFSI